MKFFTVPFLALLSCFLTKDLLAQTIQLDRHYPTVTKAGSSSVIGFGSGLNSPQFSPVDFNHDGQQDLFVFDRVGDTPMAFRRNASGNWQLDQDLLAGFPSIDSWILLRDYDNDNVPDIFTFNRLPAPGVRVFKGRYNDMNRLEFEALSFNGNWTMIPFTVPGGGVSQVYVSDIDLPDINDIDCDGDLDIVTFNISGGQIEFYRNRSVELGYGRDSLIFQLADNCFGGIFESGISEILDLADSQGECAADFGPGEFENRHVGSTLLTLDEDGDGDKDLILGDLSFGNLNMSTNGGDCSDAWMNEQDPFFPSYDVSLEIPLFPAAYHLDIDGDGIRDLVSAPNAAASGKDFDNVWFYRNTATDSEPTFRLQQEDFLVGEMIDLGSRAKPALLDYNADGLMDLVVGNFTFYKLIGLRDSRLHLYENTGTATSPAFTLVDDDFMSMTDYSLDLPPGTGGLDFAPTFGDLDGDGDADALIGDVEGRLFYFENTAGPGNPVSFGPGFYGYMNIDIGASAAPQIVDLNRDELPDLVIGEKGGAFRYYQNVGTAEEPFFGEDENEAPNVPFLGDVDGRIIGQSTGYSVPFVIDFGSHYELFMGTEHGTLERYDNIDNNIYGDFDLLSENIFTHSEGNFLHPAFWDWNNDGFLDVVVGNERGGVSFYRTNIALDGTVDTDEATAAMDVHIYPNPAMNQVTVAFEGAVDAGVELQLINLQGQVLRQQAMRSTQARLELSGLPAGIYFLRLTADGLQRTEKLIIH